MNGQSREGERVALAVLGLSVIVLTILGIAFPGEMASFRFPLLGGVVFRLDAVAEELKEGCSLPAAAEAFFYDADQN